MAFTAAALAALCEQRELCFAPPWSCIFAAGLGLVVVCGVRPSVAPERTTGFALVRRETFRPMAMYRQIRRFVWV